MDTEKSKKKIGSLTHQELTNIIAKCQETKNAWDSYYWLVFAYTQPERNIIWRGKDGFPGDLKQIPLYTQAGKNGANIFVARIQNHLTPANKKYFNFAFKDTAKPDDELRNIVELITARVNEIKEEVNLDEICNQAYFDLVAGTACIMTEKTAGGIKFKCLPITSYSLDTLENQSISRILKVPVFKIGMMFPEMLNKPVLGKDPNNPAQRSEEVELTDLTYYNEKAHIWEYYVKAGNDVIVYRRYRKSPFHILHWNRSSDMPFGVGVGMQALPAMKRLNNYIKIKLQILPFKIPMFITTSGNLLDNNIDFKPGHFLIANNVQEIQPLPLSNADTNFDFDIQHEELEIKQTFLDYTLPTDPKQMTAAEVYARSNPQDEMIALNISRLTRVIRDIGWDIFDFVFETEVGKQTGISLEQLHETLDCQVNNEATTDTITIQKLQNYVATLGQFDPAGIWQSLDRTSTLALLAKSFNLPAEIIKSKEEIDASVQQDAQAQQQMQQNMVENQMAIDNNKENAVANREMMVQQEEGE